MFAKESLDAIFASLEEYFQAEAARCSSRSEQQSLIVVPSQHFPSSPSYSPGPFWGNRGRGSIVINKCAHNMLLIRGLIAVYLFAPIVTGEGTKIVIASSTMPTLACGLYQSLSFVTSPNTSLNSKATIFMHMLLTLINKRLMMTSLKHHHQLLPCKLCWLATPLATTQLAIVGFFIMTLLPIWLGRSQICFL